MNMRIDGMSIVSGNILIEELFKLVTDIYGRNCQIEEIAVSHHLISVMQDQPNQQGPYRTYFKDGSTNYRFAGYYMIPYREYPENVIRIFGRNYTLLGLMEIDENGEVKTDVIGG